MNRLLHHVVLLLWAQAAVGADTSSTTTGRGDTTSISNASKNGHTTNGEKVSPHATCPSRTANYITHTLPSQCLRTDRIPQGPFLSTGESSLTSTTTSSSTVLDVAESVSSSSTSELINGTRILPATSTFSTTVEVYTGSSMVSDVAVATPQPLVEEEGDSPLDNANFLSFEEWKRQNLAKTGQSPEDVGRGQPINPNRPRPGINNALDTLGEESEIDLDFSGFGGAAQVPVPGSQHTRSSDRSTEPWASDSEGSILRSKDAGKTCKERTNYASFDCSATVLKSNKECKSAASVLVENKDSYMLNTCSAQNKFFIIELCNDIQIDTIVLANYEFFSSSFRHFRVSVSDRYPVKMEKWRDLGTFEARNTRDIQAFLIENPLIWAKYLRVEFLSHYGTEYYCPVSLLRVHGTTMIEDYRHQEDLAHGEVEEATLEAEVSATPPVSLEPTHSINDPLTQVVEVNSKRTDVISDSTTVSSSMSTPSSTPVESIKDKDAQPIVGPLKPMSSDEGDHAQLEKMSEPPSMNTTCETSTIDAPPSTPKIPVAEGMNATSATFTANTTHTAALNKSASAKEPLVTSSATSVSEDAASLATKSMHTASNKTEIIPTNTPSASTNITSLTVDTTSAGNTNSSMPSAKIPASTNSSRTVASSSTNPQPPQPSTQESFFKSFAKRLQQLESNSTLSLQYIEEQSRILRDAFSKVEKRQVATTTKFLSQLNDTVMAELHGFRQAYDQLWQGTVIELEGQRDTYQREMLALSSRLTMMADELVWQKRMGIVQSTLLLICLGLVLFGRSGTGALEVPLMQQMINRSKRVGWEYSPPYSPATGTRSPVGLFQRKLWRSKTEPVEEQGSLTDSEISRPQTKDGPDINIETPSPDSDVSPSHYNRYNASDMSLEQSAQSQDELKPNSSRKKGGKQPQWPQEHDQPDDRFKNLLAM